MKRVPYWGASALIGGGGETKLWDGGVWKQTSELQVLSGFDNYHKIAIHGHVCVPKFWRM